MKKDYGHIIAMLYVVFTMPPGVFVIAAILDHLLGFRDISDSWLVHQMCSYVSLMCP